MAQKSIILNMTPAQRHALGNMAKDEGFPTVSAYLRWLITADAMKTGVGATAWAETLGGIAYVVMALDESKFLGVNGTFVPRRGHAQYFNSIAKADRARIALPDPYNFRVGVVTLQQPERNKANSGMDSE